MDIPFLVSESRTGINIQFERDTNFPPVAGGHHGAVRLFLGSRAESYSVSNSSGGSAERKPKIANPKRSTTPSA